MKKIINWFKQYGYYYKYVFITISFAVALLVLGLVSCLSKESYDLKVILSGDFYIYDTEVYAYQEIFEEYIDDWNGDGEVNVQVLGLSTSAGSAELNYSYSQRFQAEVLNGEINLFITDEGKFKNLEGTNGVADVGEYLPENPENSKYFDFNSTIFAKKVTERYKKLFGSDQTPTQMKDGLRIYMRVPLDSKTTDEAYKENYTRVAKLFEKIVNEK